MMRPAFVLAAVLCALSACSPSPSASDAGSAASKGPTDARKLETQALAAHPGYARRAGDSLTLIINGKDGVRLDDGNRNGCTAMDDCAGWTFRGVEHLQSLSGIDPSILVAHDAGGERTRYAFVSADPVITWLDGWPSVSPSGQYVVAATANGAMVLYDWSTPSPHTVYDFGPDCTFLKWTSDREGQARCSYPGGKATLAYLALDGDTWRLGDDQEIDPNAADIQPVADSNLKKRATLIKGAPGKAADPAELKALGFERLN